MSSWLISPGFCLLSHSYAMVELQYWLFLTQKMSSSNSTTISTHVPILDGTDYREWSAQMWAYLQSTGLWLIVNGTTTAPTNPQALTAWTLSNSMANGNIELCLSHNIHDLVGDTSTRTWINLAMAFGATGVSKLFGDFWSMVQFCLSRMQHPSAEMSCNSKQGVLHTPVIYVPR